MSRKVSRMSRITAQRSRVMARETAFKALFQLDFNFAAEGEDSTAYEDLAIETMIDDANFLTEGNDPRKLTEEDLLYVEETVRGTRAHLKEIDAIISEHLKQSWQLSRIMAADRNILRLASSGLGLDHGNTAPACDRSAHGPIERSGRSPAQRPRALQRR